MNASVPPDHCHFLCCIEARCKTAINAGQKYNVYLALQAQIAASAMGMFNKANGLAPRPQGKREQKVNHIEVGRPFSTKKPPGCEA
jgi:hypothetical protein